LTRNLLRNNIIKGDQLLRSYSSREVIKILKKDGWYEVACDGDHHQFKHLSKKGRVTVTHPRKDIPEGTLKNIARQAGVFFK
jgi:predicted RNA binding protein YcfA (HicA-like mRNA interferase family)